MSRAEDQEEKLAQDLANAALPYRVQGREWETALLVARFVLRSVSQVGDSLIEEALLRLASDGFLLVKKEKAVELVNAMDAFGMNKNFATDSAALKRVKEALRDFREGL